MNFAGSIVPTPKVDATVLYFETIPSRKISSITNLIGFFAVSRIASQAFLIESFIELKESLTPSVVRLKSGWIVSRNQVATGLMTRSLTKFQASRIESRMTLKAFFRASMTERTSGQAVFLNHWTTALIADLIESQTLLTISQRSLNPPMKKSMTAFAIGHAVFRNHWMTASIAERIQAQTDWTIDQRSLNPPMKKSITAFAIGHAVFRNQLTTASIAERIQFQTGRTTLW